MKMTAVEAVLIGVLCTIGVVCAVIWATNYSQMRTTGEQLAKEVATLAAKASPSTDLYLKKEAHRLLKEGAFQLTIVDGRNGAGYTVEVVRGEVYRIYRDYNVKCD